MNHRKNIDMDKLYSLYVKQELTIEECTEHFDCSDGTIRNRLNEKAWTRTTGESLEGYTPANRKELDIDEIIDLYEDGMGATKIAENYNVTAKTIYNRLEESNIDINHSRSMKVVLRAEKNPHWKHGNDLLYGKEWQEQREKAIKRDSEQCLNCGITREEHYEKYKTDIHVDHIKPLHTFNRRDANYYEKAHSLDNLQTLCCSCHKEIEHKKAESKFEEFEEVFE